LSSCVSSRRVLLRRLLRQPLQEPGLLRSGQHPRGHPREASVHEPVYGLPELPGDAL